jgi:hypothetical protein
MNSMIVVALLILLLAPHIPLSAFKDSKAGVVTLTADQVTSAIDIETAMHQVTREGQRPGVIILDGRAGPFIYTGPDRTINFFFSNLTLRGINGATLADTDGIYLDNVPADDLVIEDLVMNSSSDCVGMVGSHNRVTIRRILCRAAGMGVGVNTGSDWQITDNTIVSNNYAIFLIRTKNAAVTCNHLSGSIGVVMEGARLSAIKENAFSSGWQGVLLNREAYRNLVANNSMIGIQAAGIALEPGVQNNTIRANDVLCARDTACLTVDAQPGELETNAIQGNRP